MELLEIIGTIVGLIYLWLEYRASIYLWIVGIIMPAIYLYIYYKAGLYADFGINIYYLIAAIYGWTCWQVSSFKARNGKEKPGNVKEEAESNMNERSEKAKTATETPITHMPRRYWLPLTAVFALAFFLIATILINFTDSDVAWLDSFTTALSIIGMWMLAKKYVEQWWPWIATDIVSSGLYIYKGLYFTSALYALYTIIAIFGYLKWKKLICVKQ